MQSVPHATILFAEDEVLLREMFAKVFVQHGFTVLQATNGKEALEIALRHSGEIDLLVSNVQMPEMTGPDLARALRASRPGLRVLLLSGYAEGVLLLDRGWLFLRKPVLPKDVVAKIVDVLGRPAAPDVDKNDTPGQL